MTRITKTNQNLISRAEKLLENIHFQNYVFTVRHSRGSVFLQAHYPDADIYSGKIEEQFTRKWFLSPLMTDSEMVQTAFKCCFTSFEHRCREAFTYKGARVFGPHFDINDLVTICKDGREDAGGRK